MTPKGLNIMNNNLPPDPDTTATPKSIKSYFYPDFAEVDRQARADTYLQIAQWVKACPPTRGAKELRTRALVLAGCEAELQDLGFSLVESDAKLVDLIATRSEPTQ
jgi:hypothetical protein